MEQNRTFGQKIKAFFLLTTTLLFLFIILQSFYFQGIVKKDQFKNDIQYHVSSIEEAVVSADAMNVFYIGVDNPLSIAVSNTHSNEIIVSMSGAAGTITKQLGCKYVVRVNGQGVAIIHVSAKQKNGTMVVLAQKEFRIRTLPKPVAYWGTIGNHGLPIPRNALIAQKYIFASLGDGFVIDGLKYEVLSYQFMFVPAPNSRNDPFVKRVSGSAIDSQVKNIIRKADAGGRIFVDLIRAKGPDGVRNLSPICLPIL